LPGPARYQPLWYVTTPTGTYTWCLGGATDPPVTVTAVLAATLPIELVAVTVAG
jgi:hypothetical protein